MFDWGWNRNWGMTCGSYPNSDGSKVADYINVVLNASSLLTRQSMEVGLGAKEGGDGRCHFTCAARPYLTHRCGKHSSTLISFYFKREVLPRISSDRPFTSKRELYVGNLQA